MPILDNFTYGVVRFSNGDKNPPRGILDIIKIPGRGFKAPNLISFLPLSIWLIMSGYYKMPGLTAWGHRCNKRTYYCHALPASHKKGNDKRIKLAGQHQSLRQVIRRLSLQRMFFCYWNKLSSAIDFNWWKCVLPFLSLIRGRPAGY